MVGRQKIVIPSGIGLAAVLAVGLLWTLRVTAAEPPQYGLDSLIGGQLLRTLSILQLSEHNDC